MYIERGFNVEKTHDCLRIEAYILNPKTYEYKTFPILPKRFTLRNYYLDLVLKPKTNTINYILEGKKTLLQ